MTMIWLVKSLLISFLFLSACSPCWDKRDNAQVLQCLERYPTEDILLDKQTADYLSKHKVYVSLTTSPKRISKIKWVLKGLDLTHVDTVYLSLPDRYKNKDDYATPTNLTTDFPKLKIIRRAHDLGPIMKLIPAVEEIQALGDLDALVITIDDDTAYPRGMIGQLIKESTRRQAVVAGCGQTAHFHGYQQYWFEPAALFPAVNLVEGYCGIAYPIRFVDIERMKKISTVGPGNVCKTSDDLVISWVLAEKKVPRFEIQNKFFPGNRQLQFGFEDDALHKGSGCTGPYCDNDSRYQACAKALSEFVSKESHE